MRAPEGVVAEGFESVQNAFEKLLTSGEDVGASVAVMTDGELVVDLWGGCADEASSVPWQRDTIVNVFSSTKTMTALCVLLLADRGEVDLHAPVARYWPEFVAKEIAEPFGADFHIGLAVEDDHRVARLIPPDALPIEIEPGSILARTLANPPMQAEWAHTAGWRRAEIPAANGHGNARSMAQVQSILSCDGEGAGVRFMSSGGSDRVYEVQSDGVDLVLGIPMRFGMGFAVSCEGMPFRAGRRAFFWGGWGGSLVVNDPDERLTFAYAMNRMGQGTVGDERSASLLAAMYGSLPSRPSG